MIMIFEKARKLQNRSRQNLKKNDDNNKMKMKNDNEKLQISNRDCSKDHTKVRRFQ